MKNMGMAVSIVLATLLAAPAFAMGESDHGQAVVTILPNVAGKAHSTVNVQDLSLKVAGKDASVTKWERYKSPASKMELVLLFDDSARTSIGNQRPEIEKFINGLAPGTKAVIAYMDYGKVEFAGPLTADHAAVLRGLRLPSGLPGSSAGAYFCLSYLAKHWPGQDVRARREVVMVTNGLSYYQTQFDPYSPDVVAAIDDSTRAGLLVYSIYWADQGRAGGFGSFSGQSTLGYVTEATGGRNFWMGTGDPVSFGPYFEELNNRFQNQYKLGFVGSGGAKSSLEPMKVKLSVPGSKVDAPSQVLVVPGL
ncbi:MAG: hypothetical protein ABSD44_04445 [Terracidiphilus sp.]